MCLLIGPSKVGKTSFLQKLQDDGLISIQQTDKNKDNVNIQDFVITLKSKINEIRIHELNCRSHQQITLKNNCKAILYMIDSANRFQISEAFICLLEILKNKQFSTVPVLILLNKCDEVEAMTRDEVELYFHFKEVIQCVSGQNNNTNNKTDGEVMGLGKPDLKQNRLVNVIECSSLNGTGLPHALSWLVNLYSTAK